MVIELQCQDKSFASMTSSLWKMSFSIANERAVQLQLQQPFVSIAVSATPICHSKSQKDLISVALTSVWTAILCL